MRITANVTIRKSAIAALSNTFPADNGKPSPRECLAFIEEAISKGTEPQEAPPSSTDSETVSIVLKDKVAANCIELANKNELSLNKYLSALFDAHSKSIGGSQHHAPSKLDLQIAPRKARPAQTTFYSALTQAFEAGGIGLNEAATGIGKTAAILCAAAEQSKKTQSRIVIAVPTIGLIQDFAHEYNRLNLMPALRIIVGRQEFISEHSLRLRMRDWEGDKDAKIAVQKWIDEDGMPHDSGIPVRWLASSLQRFAPTFPIDSSLYLPQIAAETDLGLINYQEQFLTVEEEPEEEIILCTHAMLANNLRLKTQKAYSDESVQQAKRNLDILFKTAVAAKQSTGSAKSLVQAIDLASRTLADTISDQSKGAGRIPEFKYLVVDEAHLVEQSFSSALSDYVSINQLKESLETLTREGAFTKSALNAYAETTKQMIAIAENDNADMSAISSEYSDLLSRFSDAISQGLKKTSKNTPQHVESLIKQVKRDAFLLKVAGMTKAGVASFINFSPVRKFPQVHVGKSSLNEYFSTLWASVAAASCVSATLYLPKADGTRSAAYLQNILNIPKDRAMQFNPIVPKWVRGTLKEFSIVDLKKTLDGRTYLRRPSRKDKLNDSARASADLAWLTDVAQELTEIDRTAEGGVLVLMTAYKLSESLYHLLPEEMRIRTLVSKPKTTISQLLHEFHVRRAAGEKVVWLAVGSAWTGVNIGGHEPMKIATGHSLAAKDDNILTDLVIPALPFGTNKTITHITRRERHKNSHVEIVETIFKTMQGIGRLVRREGLPKNRRIRILDARLVDGTLRNLKSSILQMMDRG